VSCSGESGNTCDAQYAGPHRWIVRLRSASLAELRPTADKAAVPPRELLRVLDEVKG